MKYLLWILSLVLALVLLALFQIPDNNLHIIACNVGQGDAILVTYKNKQILTDGGPDNSVLSCLGRYMPFWDRSIDLVISSHSDADHITGLVDVLKRYKVEKILINPINPGTEVYRLLEHQAWTKNLEIINPISGMGIGIGLIHLEIYNPTLQKISFLKVENQGSKTNKYTGAIDANLYSIVYKLSLGGFSGLFTGDMPKEISDELSQNNMLGNVNYIKIPHHGSDNGLTQNLLEKLNPKVAVTSVGKDNQWDFPSSSVLGLLNDKKVKIFRTDLMGDVEVVTNGKSIWYKKTKY